MAADLSASTMLHVIDNLLPYRTYATSVKSMGGFRSNTTAMPSSASDPRRVPPAPSTHPLSKPSSIATSTRPYSR